MVLNTPTMPSLFPRSTADGDGYGTNIQQRRKNEGSLGPSRMTLLHSGEGEYSNLAIANLDSHTFAKGDFLKEEKLIIMLALETNEVNTIIKYLFSDSAGSITTGALPGATFGMIFFLTEGMQSIIDNDDIQILTTKNRTVGVPGASVMLDMTDENVITTPWTITLTGNRVLAGTNYYRWWIYRVGYLEDI